MRLSLVTVALLLAAASYAEKSSHRASKAEAASKRSKTGPVKSSVHLKKHSFKKQRVPGSLFPGQGLGGEPIGNLGLGGPPGLAGDADGIPTGMGGGEPLGYGPVGMPRGPMDLNQYEDRPGIDDVGGPMNSFSGPMSGPMNGFMPGPMNGLMSGPMEGAGPKGFPGPQLLGGPDEKDDYVEGNQGYEDPATTGFDGVPPGIEGPHFKTPDIGEASRQGQEFQDQDGAPGAGSQFTGIGMPTGESYMNLPSDMGASMSNTLDAMDKANIQGDSEVGKIVRAAKGNSELHFSHKPVDPAVISPSEVGGQNEINVPISAKASFEDMQMDPSAADQVRGWSSEQRGDAIQDAAKRKLVRMRGKKDHKFKSLQETSKNTTKS